MKRNATYDGTEIELHVKKYDICGDNSRCEYNFSRHHAILPVIFQCGKKLQRINDLVVHSLAEHLLQFSLHGLLNFSLHPVLNNNFYSPLVYSHLAPNICFNNEKHMFWGWEAKFYDFLTCFLVWLKYFWARNIQFRQILILWNNSDDF